MPIAVSLAPYLASVAFLLVREANRWTIMPSATDVDVRTVCLGDQTMNGISSTLDQAIGRP